jgi:hypothetical protein
MPGDVPHAWKNICVCCDDFHIMWPAQNGTFSKVEVDAVGVKINGPGAIPPPDTVEVAYNVKNVRSTHSCHNAPTAARFACAPVIHDDAPQTQRCAQWRQSYLLQQSRLPVATITALSN